jgi:enoyl-CoA hydratase
MLLATLGLPCPMVAAINGHAIAGGCLLACAADRRLMARGSGRAGVPELRVGVPFPPVALELARASVQPHAMQRAIAGGETFDPETAQAVGLVDDLVDAERLLDLAIDLATDLATIAPATYALTKAMLQQPMHDRIARQTEAHGAQVNALWSDAATFTAVSDYIERTMRKG